MDDLRRLAHDLFLAGVRSADPCEAVRLQEPFIRSRVAESGGRIFIAGFGKAACRMAEGMCDIVGDMVLGGLLITGYNHGPHALPDSIRVVPASHPLPGMNGVAGTQQLLYLLRHLPPDIQVAILISGGGSAFLVAPVEEVTLEEKQEVTRLLLASGAHIGELNCVRKHLSRVKGGRLLEAVSPHRAVSLILSDVIDDPLDVIASGPTAPDATTFADALRVLGRYRLLHHVPESVSEYLERGRRGLVPETLKDDSPLFAMVDNRIVGSNRMALDAVARAAAGAGFCAEVIGSGLRGEAREAGRNLARRALEARAAGGAPRCLIAGGETTVTVAGSGRGGRNQELALAAAIELEGRPGVTLLSAGTDGIDGPTEAAGAVVDGDTVQRALSQGLDPERFLRENDSHSFFAACGGLVITGATGTNVMDLQIVLVT